jgi:hypothetical protein
MIRGASDLELSVEMGEASYRKELPTGESLN